MEMWIGYEVQCGSVPGRCDGALVLPADSLIAGKDLFRSFVAASRALLRGALAPEVYRFLVEEGAGD